MLLNQIFILVGLVALIRLPKDINLRNKFNLINLFDWRENARLDHVLLGLIVDLVISRFLNKWVVA